MHTESRIIVWPLQVLSVEPVADCGIISYSADLQNHNIDGLSASDVSRYCEERGMILRWCKQSLYQLEEAWTGRVALERNGHVSIDG